MQGTPVQPTSTSDSAATDSDRRAPALGLPYVGGVLTAPERTFGDLATRPRTAWVAPMIVGAILTALGAWIMLPEILDVSYTSAEAVMRKMGAPEDQIRETLAQMPLEATSREVVTQVLPNLVSTPVFILLGALFVHLVSRIFGGDSRFGPTLGMFSVAYIIWAIGALVRGGLAAASDTVDVTLGPGALIPGHEVLSPLGIFLDLFDVFSVWHIFVLVTGIAVVTRVSRGTAWGVGVAFWVVRSLAVAGGRVFMLWTQGG